MSQRRTTLRALLGWVVFLAVAIGGHEWLKRVMLEDQIVASLLSPGSHTSSTVKVTAVGFLLLRVLVVFCLPGILLSRLGLIFFDRLCGRTAKT